MPRKPIAYDDGLARVSAGKKYVTTTLRTPLGSISKRVSYRKLLRAARRHLL